VQNFGGDLKLKRLELTCSDQVDFMTATLRSTHSAVPSIAQNKKRMKYMYRYVTTNV